MGNQNSTLQQSTLLSHLPLEVVRQICLYLPPQDVGHLIQSCKTLQKLTNDTYLWKLLYLRDFSQIDNFRAKQPEEDDTNLDANNNSTQVYSKEDQKAACIVVADNSSGVSWATLKPEDKPPLLEKKDNVVTELEFALLRYYDGSRGWNPIVGVITLSPQEVVLIEFQTLDEAQIVIQDWQTISASAKHIDPSFVTISHTLFDHPRRKEIKEFLTQMMADDSTQQPFLNSWKSSYQRQVINQRFIRQQQQPPQKSLLQRFRSILSGNHEEASFDEFPVNPSLKKRAKPVLKKKGMMSARRLQQGPVTSSVVALGMKGAGTRSIIEYLEQKHPYSQEVRNANNWKVTFPGHCTYLNETALTFFICNDEFLLREVSRDFSCFTLAGIHIDGIVVVVDSSTERQEDLNQLSELFKKFLEHATKNPQFDPTILCLAHKQDQLECLTPSEVAKILQIDALQYNWAVMPSSLAMPGSLEACFTWLTKWTQKRDSSYFRGGCTII